jgi:hypothetical protein
MHIHGSRLHDVNVALASSLYVHGGEVKRCQDLTHITVILKVSQNSWFGRGFLPAIDIF